MYRIEAETVDGKSYWYGQPWEENGIMFETMNDADSRAEGLWIRHTNSLSGIYARFSVIDQDGNTISDWEL